MNIKKVNIFLGVMIIGGLTFIALQSYKIYPFNDKPQQTESSKKDSSEEPVKVSRKSDYDSYIEQGDKYFSGTLYELAINEYTKANKEKNNESEAFMKIGKAHLALKNTGKARSNFKSALELEPTNLDARIGLGKTFIAERDIEEAKNIFEPLHNDDARIKYYKGIIFAYLKDYEKSKEELIKGISLENSNEEIKQKTQAFLNAYDEFERNKGGTEIHLQTLLAKAFNNTGEYQMAIPLLFDVLKEKNNYIDAWVLMGYANLQLNKIQDAIDAFEKAKEFAPQRADNLLYLGLAYFNKEDYEKAIENLELALENEYEPAGFVKQKLAEIYVITEDYEKAGQSYEELLSANVSNINAFVRPIWIYIDKLSQPQRALDLALIGLEKHPDAAMAHNLVGWSYMANNNLNKARRYLIEAIKIDQQLDAAYLNLGTVYEEINKPVTALKLYKKAEAIKGDPSITALAQRKYHKLRIKEEQKQKFNQNYQANTLKP